MDVLCRIADYRPVSKIPYGINDSGLISCYTVSESIAPCCTVCAASVQRRLFPERECPGDDVSIPGHGTR